MHVKIVEEFVQFIFRRIEWRFSKTSDDFLNIFMSLQIVLLAYEHLFLMQTVFYVIINKKLWNNLWKWLSHMQCDEAGLSQIQI